MPEIGQSLSHYNIVEKIGRGGMGEVYRAKDQKLGRDVAIKVLPEEFARNTDRVARFQREAKLLASLNHPNIAAIHGLEEFGGTSFLVLELVEGQTLADRIKAGPIPVEESLKLALQIAEALEAAHEKGVIHRDLKPANIKVTPDGKVKVLDFGLAKAFAGEQADLNLSNSPTLSNAATQEGVILGTAAYMSPEQAKGKMVDKRADIWAFGVLLFEMLTGRQLFSGETVSEILAAVLLKEPDFSKLPATLHPRIRLLLERCLEKEVKDRYSSAADVRVDIQKAFNAPSGALFQQSPAAQSAKTLRKMLPWIAATAILGVIAGGLAVWMLKGPEQHQVIRFDHEIAGDQKFANIPYPILAVSPDGKKVAYSTSSGGLFLRSMNEMTAKRISDPGENTSTPFFSPDSQWIGYWSMTDFKLKKISINGGAPIALCDASDVVGASWSADSAIVFASMGKGIMRISPAGGVPEVLIDSKTEPFYHPRLLPDKKSLLFTVLTAEGYKIGVKSLKSAERKILFPGDCAWYLPTGYIVYALEYNLFVVPFDLGTLQVTGATAPMADPIWRFGAAYAPQYAVSDSGTLAYLPQTTAASTPERILVWVDRQGKEEPIKLPVNAYNNPRISPDGRKVALVIGTQNQNIWIGDLTRGNLTRLTFEGGNDIVPLWTPDGKRIVFASNRAGYYSIYAKAADGTGDIEKFGSLSTQMNYIPSCWAASSKTLMITYMESSYNVGALSEGNDQVLKPLLNGKQNEMVPNVSPDGRWIAYTSNESGRGEVFVRPFPEVNKGKWQASTSGGSDPLWSPDGRELFYRAGESIMVVPVKTDRVFSLETPKELFQGSYVQSNIAEALGPEFHPWDISPDGRRLLMMKEPKSASPSGTGPRKINIVLNWLDELKQRVPVK